MSGVVLLLFLVSGACGLIYEVAWSRLMTQIFGTSALAVGIVLAAFMAGMAAGSYLLGNRADRAPRPLRLYAFCEIGIGLAALGSLLVLDRVGPLYLRAYQAFGDSTLLLSAIRFLVAFALILIPTILMGATLPILSRFIVTNMSSAVRHLGSLYAINTLGAVAGALLAGFCLIGAFGIRSTIHLAVGGNVGIALLALLLSRRSGKTRRAAAGNPAPARPAGKPAAADRGGHRLLLFAIGLSGMTSFAYEVLWTRSLVFLLGNSTYAFTLMLTAFLSGIALGGFLIRFVADRARSPVALFAWLEIAIGSLAVAVLPLLFTITDSETIRSFLERSAGRFGPLILSRFGASMLVMLIPATLIGATFPLVGRLCLSDLRRTGREIGTVYAVNTIGNVAGALLPAFLIIPLLGIQKGVALMGAINVGVGGIVLLSLWKQPPWRRAVAQIAVAGMALLLTGLPIDFEFPSQQQTVRHRVLYDRDGPLATTRVFLDPETQEKLMSIDGVVIGGTGVTDYKQQLLAHLPKLFLKEYESELTVGLGSAILVGESARHPGLRRIVCVEIEPTVAEGAAYFREENHAVLEDPRVEIIVDDVANYLRTTDERFDIVSADEKTAENYASNGFSYSRDYYYLLRDHLTPRGVMVQWMTSLPASQYAMVLKTFTGAFPHVSIWYFTPVGNKGPSNVILVGSPGVIVLDQAWMNAVLKRRADDFAGIGKYGLTNAESVLAHYVAGGDTIRMAVREAPVNSLEHPRFEFYSPREYAVSGDERTLRLLDFLASIREPDIPHLVADGDSDDAADRLRGAIAAEREFLAGFRRQLRNEPLVDVTAHFDRALEAAPWNENLRYQILLYYWNTAGNNYLRGDYPRALRFMRKAVETYDRNGEAFYYLGLTLLQNGEVDAAVEALQNAVRLEPKLVSARHRLASYFLERGRAEEAAAQLRAILAIDGDNLFALVSYGLQLASMEGRYSEALDDLRRAYRLAPDDPLVIDGYAWVSYLSGDRPAARRIVRDGGDYYSGSPQLERRRGTILSDRP